MLIYSVAKTQPSIYETSRPLPLAIPEGLIVDLVAVAGVVHIPQTRRWLEDIHSLRKLTALRLTNRLQMNVHRSISVQLRDWYDNALAVLYTNRVTRVHYFRS